MESPSSNDIVSADWLHANLDHDNLIILDATIPKVGQGEDQQSGFQIPNSVFFDIKHAFSDPNAPFPNTVPKLDQFEREARNIGINNDSLLMVYDELGMYSSPRAWYLLKAFGHEHVAVLNGGLPAWIEKGFETEKKGVNKGPKGNFEAHYNPRFFIDLSNLRHSEEQVGKVILDARSKDRFLGEVPEPRKGLRSGTIPNSKNLPYTELFDGLFMKPKDELVKVFEKVSGDNDQLIMSCGSGITACILALGASITGKEDITVYDGSWTEYGSMIKP